MAISSTIYKFTISLSDLDRHHYDRLNLTVAQHPSENTERMMARVLAYCINAREDLSFTKGLSTPETPDIWAKTLDGQIDLWIEIGEPAADKLKKASRLAKEVRVYSFNSKSEVWWSQESKKIVPHGAKVYRFDWKAVEAMAALVERTMDMSITITDDSAYIVSGQGECEVAWSQLE